MLSPSRNATVDAQKASHQSFFLNRESVSTSLLLNVPRIGNHRNSDEQKEREILLTPPASEEQKSSEKSALKRIDSQSSMLSVYSITSGKSRKDAISKIKAKPIVLTDKQLEDKIKSGAATLKQRNLLLFRKQRDLT